MPWNNIDDDDCGVECVCRLYLDIGPQHKMQMFTARSFFFFFSFFIDSTSFGFRTVSKTEQIWKYINIIHIDANVVVVAAAAALCIER